MPSNNRTIGYISLLTGTILFLFCGVYLYFSTIYGYCYRTAYSDDIGNLKLDNKVKVSGMEVGRVEGLTREGNRAKIVLRMRDKIKIRSGYIFENRDYGLMGDRALFLNPGTDGEIIPIDSPLKIEFIPGIAEGIRNADSLKVIVNRMQVLIKDYSRIDPRNDSLFTTQLMSVLKCLDQTSAKLEKMVAQKEPVITRNINRTSEYAIAARSTLAQIKPKTEKIIANTNKLSSDAIVLLDKIIPVLDTLNIVLQTVVDEKNIVGKAIANKDLYVKLIDSLNKVRKVLGVLKSEGVGLDIDLF